jgi:hypothetical protein
MKLTKMAIERATETLSRKCNDTMKAWDKRNPKPEEHIGFMESLEMALNDPDWRKAFLRRAARRDGYNDLRLNETMLREDCRKCRIEYDRIENRNNARKQLRNAEERRLELARNALLDRAMIGNMTAEELLAAVTAF